MCDSDECIPGRKREQQDWALGRDQHGQWPTGEIRGGSSDHWAAG